MFQCKNQILFLNNIGFFLVKNGFLFLYGDLKVNIKAFLHSTTSMVYKVVWKDKFFGGKVVEKSCRNSSWSAIAGCSAQALRLALE